MIALNLYYYFIYFEKMALIDDLISYWKLDEISGNAEDSHGSNDLTNINSTPYVAAKINNGADFEASNSNQFSISNGAQSGLSLGSSDFSFSLWIKIESIGGNKTLISKYKYTDNTRSYQLGIDTNGDIFLTTSSNGSDTPERIWTSANLTTATWYHIVVVKVGTSATLYINGTEISGGSGSLASSLYNTTADFRIGALATDDNLYDGIIDEVGIWARALSSGEVSELYNSGAGLQYPFTPPIVAPSVDTLDATDITASSGNLNGEITDTGGENADERGFVWDSQSKSAPGNVAPASSGYEDYFTDSGDFSEGVFDHGIESLDTGTIYYFRAYAHNSEGYTYGEELTIETLPGEIFRFENIPGVEYNPNDKQTIFAERLNEILDRLHDLDGLDPYEE